MTKFITNLILTMNKLIINHHPPHHHGAPHHQDRPNRQDHPHVDHPQPVGLFPGKYSVAMVKGDCSLTISNVDLKIDDGEWECQVCQTNYLSYYDSLKEKASVTPMGIWSKWGPNFCRETSCGLKRYHPPTPPPLI